MKSKKQKNKNIHIWDECDYIAIKVVLNDAGKSNIEGIRHPCDECEYSATTSGFPKTHEDYRHKGIK